MVAGLLVVVAPALSVATTVSTCVPDGTFLQVYAYGAVASWPRTAVPSRNSTLATLPSASLALALTVTVGFHANTAPSPGAVIAAVGGVLAVALTVTVAGALVVVKPSWSVARAVTL